MSITCPKCRIYPCCCHATQTFGPLEADPNGIDQHAKGAKLDAGKPRVDLMFKSFPRALLAVAEVTTFGAEKYTPMGWVEVEDGVNRYADAKGRHMLTGHIEDIDADSDLEHDAQEAWNALAKLELKLRKNQNN